MIEATLSIRAPDWVESISKKHSGRVTILACMPQAEGGARDLVELVAPEDRMEGAIKELKDHPHFERVEVARSGRERALATISSEKCSLCNAVALSDCFLLSASTEGDAILWSILASGNESVNALIARLKENGFDVEIKKIKEIKKKEDLTRRQEEIIRIALEKGYFDHPKRIGIRELGKLMGVSISTLSEVLRSGQRKILSSYFAKK